MRLPPEGWSLQRIEAFNDLMDAIGDYELYSAALTRLGVTVGPLITRRNELRDHILNVLGPRFRDAP